MMRFLGRGYACAISVVMLTLPFTSVAGELEHVVSSDAPTLYEMSILLYGKRGFWKELAELNGITDPRAIRLGQKLKLKRPPSLTPEEGRRAVLNHWRIYFSVSANVDSVPPAPVKETIVAKVESPTRAILKVQEQSPLFPESFEAPQAPPSPVAVPAKQQDQISEVCQKSDDELMKASLAGRLASASDFSFTICRGRKPIKALSLKREIVEARVSRPNESEYRVSMELDGRLDHPKDSLLLSSEPVSIQQPSGDFSVMVDARSPVTTVSFTHKRSQGKPRTETLRLVANHWGAIQQRLKVGALVRDRISGGLSLVSTNYRHTILAPFSQTSINGKLGYTHYFKPKTFYFDADVYGTLIPLSSSQSGTTLRQIGTNARIGYYFWPTTGPWRLGLASGLFFTSAYDSNREMGFEGLWGWQLNPRLLYAKNVWDIFGFYLKAAPLASPVSFSNRELAAGASWTHTLVKGQAFSVGFDVSNIQFTTAGNNVVKFTNLVLSLGIPLYTK